MAPKASNKDKEQAYEVSGAVLSHTHSHSLLGAAGRHCRRLVQLALCPAHVRLASLPAEAVQRHPPRLRSGTAGQQRLPRGLCPLLLQGRPDSGPSQVFFFGFASPQSHHSLCSNSKWSKGSLKITTIVSEKLLSVGDALRELDARQVLSNDFVLLSGDIVANLDLKKVLEEHKQRRLSDKNCIMTMVLKQASPNHRTIPKGDEALFIIDPSSQKCVRYIPLDPFLKRKKIELDVDDVLMSKNSPFVRELDLRTDLLDCQIDICSLEVLADFTENFDYQDMRRDFVAETVASEFGRSIHTHILTTTYAARASTPQTYDAISRDVISRWSFPLSPSHLSNHYPPTSHSRGLRARDAIIARSAIVGRGTIIGPMTSVAAGARIERSVVGSDCVIGDAAIIEDSYVWDGAKVEAGARIQGTIVGDGAILRKGCVVGVGCVVGPGVVVGEGVVVKPSTRLSLFVQNVGDLDADGESEDESNEGRETVFGEMMFSRDFDFTVVGKDGKGYVWLVGEDEAGDRKGLAFGSIGFEVPVEELSDEEDTVVEDTDEEEYDFEEAESIFQVNFTSLGNLNP
ncbi:hypothetical protein HK096_002027 [Nowakowskiella sp. JEL0078]|nr:hypothetical protein HK096_002027 [Nowakowskiella sp. JEL0078]